MNPQNTLEQLVEVFRKFRMAPIPGADQFETAGKNALIAKMYPFVVTSDPIEFVMLGYPMKSPNDRDKVIGFLPDLGEEVSLANFQTFNLAIREVYPPGVSISIVSDGYVFNDIMQVSDDTVQAYEEQCIELARVAPIQWFDAKDFYSKGRTLYNIRETIMNQFGISTAELERRILIDPDVNTLYRGMIRFLSIDLAIRPFDSNNQLHKQAKIVAKEMMHRNEAYSQLISNEFKNAIRLSMHPSINNGTKFSFQLIPSPKAWTSPWHSAILINAQGEMETIHRKDAIAAGFELKEKSGRPYYFQQTV